MPFPTTVIRVRKNHDLHSFRNPMVCTRVLGGRALMYCIFVQKMEPWQSGFFLSVDAHASNCPQMFADERRWSQYSEILSADIVQTFIICAGVHAHGSSNKFSQHNVGWWGCNCNDLQRLVVQCTFQCCVVVSVKYRLRWYCHLSAFSCRNCSIPDCEFWTCHTGSTCDLQVCYLVRIPPQR